MPRSTKKSSPKRSNRVAKKTQAKKSSRSKVVKLFAGIKTRVKSYMVRRPHRTFRLTRRRDLPVVSPLPSNIIFTTEVFGVIRRYKIQYLWLLVIYVIVFSLLAGFLNQDSYYNLTEAIKSLSNDVVGGRIDKATQTIALFGAAMSGAFNSSLTELQQALLALLGIMTWLSVVWFLRHRAQNIAVSVRDTIYSSGAPLVSTMILAFVGLVQMLPGAIAVILYSSAVSSGIIQDGFESMAFAIAAGLLVVLSLYWLTSTLFAMIIVTIPATRPFKAFSLAGDLVTGRRLQLMLRTIWVLVVLFIIAFFLLIPAILLADWLPFKWLPIVPLTLQILSGITILFSTTYIYMLYRRVIDEPIV